VHAFRDRPEPGTVGVSVRLGDEDIEIVVHDDGSGMAPRHDSPGLGLGLPLIRRLADGFDHRLPSDGGTELWMRFVLPGGAKAGATGARVSPIVRRPRGPQRPNVVS
jgi:anti-sigma regulatory factor (Ser/Thr protein kinase)